GGHQENLPPRGFDRAAAIRLLSQAGYPRGFRTDFDYFAKYRSADAVVSVLRDQLARVGIVLAPRTGTTSEVSARIESRGAAFYLAGWVSDTGETGSSYEALLHTPRAGFGMYNGGGYSDPEVDRLIEQSGNAHDVSERAGFLTQIAQKLYDDVPVIPLYRQA